MRIDHNKYTITVAPTTAIKSLAMRNHAPQAQTTHRRVEGPGGEPGDTAQA